MEVLSPRQTHKQWELCDLIDVPVILTMVIMSRCTHMSIMLYMLNIRFYLSLTPQ